MSHGKPAGSALDSRERGKRAVGSIAQRCLLVVRPVVADELLATISLAAHHELQGELETMGGPLPTNTISPKRTAPQDQT